MTDAILAIDQGTTNTKVLLFEGNGTILSAGSAPLNVHYPQPGWAETDGAEVLHSTRQAIAECLKDRPIPITAIGISNQRETVLLWDRRTGEPLGPCIIWQCRRSSQRIDRLRRRDVEDLVIERTGLSLDPLFPAAKIGWLLDEIPGARERARRGELCAGSIDSWLLFNLTGGKIFATDFSNAARTQLFDIQRGGWDDELCELFEVPKAILAECRSSDSRFGETTSGGPLPAKIPVHAMIGDSHAALFGHGVRRPGAIKATYGTGSSLMTLTEQPVASKSGLSSTIAWRRGGESSYALEGNITVSGQAAAWCASMLGLENADALTELARNVSHSGGVCFVPALAGLGAPHWNPDARGVFTGLSLSTAPAHLARATLDAIAFQVADVFSAMERDSGCEIDKLLVDGGPTSNAMLMQIQANLLGRQVMPAQVRELSALGAAAMAGIGVGTWDEQDVLDRASIRGQVYLPTLLNEERIHQISRWHRAIRSSTAP